MEYSETVMGSFFSLRSYSIDSTGARDVPYRAQTQTQTHLDTHTRARFRDATRRFENKWLFQREMEYIFTSTANSIA